ncbi:Dolichyl-phosphate-mannose-protein mannosyltransferase [Granulicella rosea]|uniref:Dolichyl-phosphate-mannose-protein mannosyltransferase n=1 Tax=Granulicella rosea TaxID=474952 RepID=A0A239ELV3_9BACT|nr:glycosyltransferase family 39 protein [Granulicella rosea]SNS45645.1 Dolichyl-phosphate-mannose-protein mannosyltransferase [Granulicella rosea]
MTETASRRARVWWVIALPLAVGLLLRIWFVFHAARVAGDALIYGDIAKNLLQHGVYGFTRMVNGVAAAPRPTLIRLPGYPLFMALCFKLFGIDRYVAVMLVQVFIDLGTCLIVAALARRLFGERAGLAALWLACICPFTAVYVAVPLTETLSLACIAAAFYALERWQAAGAGLNRWMVAIAAALAYAILLRPEQGMLAAAVVPAMLWIAFAPGFSVRRGLPVLAASFLTLLPLAPWAIRNERTFHLFQPLAPRFATDPGEAVPLGFQRWYRTWAVDFASTEQVYWNYDGGPINIADLPDRAFDSNEQYEQTAALLEDYNRTSTQSKAFDARFDAIATDRIHVDPLRYYLALPVARVLNMVVRPRTELLEIPLEWWKYRSWPRKTALAAGWGFINLVYLALAGAGFYRWRRRWDGMQALAWSMLATILLRCALLLTLDNSEPRYTLEFYPVLLVFAAALWRDRTAEEK